jgi:hypothetical protein
MSIGWVTEPVTKEGNMCLTGQALATRYPHAGREQEVPEERVGYFEWSGVAAVGMWAPMAHVQLSFGNKGADEMWRCVRA